MSFSDLGTSSGQGPQGRRKVKELSDAPMSMTDFLPVAISITRALAELQRRNIVYKNITPDNIFLNSQTDIATFSDLPKTSSISGGDSLTYISPEQTGRTNQAIDSRSDYYSLGMVFYQLLTGTLPFQANDAMGWVHCHIARMPRSPAEINPLIPSTVADIVMKLLSKSVTERYQTASALLSDLEKCLTSWAAKGKVDSFPLAENDIPDQILIPSHLYGREKNIVVLLDALERVSSQGTPEILMVAGHSGIGKTSLVRELYKSAVRKKGHFISGKSDQYKRNIPYSTVAEAFRELIQQILTGNKEQIATWREQFLQALDTNAQLIVDIIPQFELIVGRQDSVEKLAPLEAQNRFTMVFQQFIGVFTLKNHPLIIFVDDLQWVDPASLKLLEDIITDSETHNLLLIGAYRDNYVDPTHPLMLRLDNIRETQVQFQTITLTPLSLKDLGRMLATTFSATGKRLDPLTKLVHQKTAGNPFFVIQFLDSLHSDGLVAFDEQQGCWHWDLKQITARQHTDNVVDLMTVKLKKLSPETQEILSLAACVGNRFDRDTLMAISKSSAQDLHPPLKEAVQENMIVLQPDDRFRFIHDRVQQAAYSLIPESEQPAVHLRIGRLMLEDCTTTEPQEQLFDIVHQLNLGGSQLTEQTERYRVAKLNLLAGKKAKTATAYEAALDYFSTGTRLLDANVWETDYGLAFGLFKEQAEVEYLNSNYAASKQLIDMLLVLAKTDLEKAELYNILIVQNTLLANYPAAIQSGCKALNLLGICVPETNLKEELDSLLFENAKILNNKPIASLIDAPEITDPDKVVSLELLSNMVVPARYTDSTLFALVSVLNVNISLRFGLTPKSTVGYTAYGMVLNSVMGQYQQALDFGELSLRLSERFNAPAQKCQACFMIGHYLNHWVRPLALADDILNDGVRAGLIAGEMQWTGYIYAYKLFQPFYRGVRPELILDEIPKLLAFTRKTKNQWATDTLLAIQLALTFLDKTERQPGPAEEETFYAACEQHRSFGAKGRYAVFKMQILYLYGRNQEALAAAQQAAALLDFFSSSISVAAHNFYHSLTLTALYEQASTEEKRTYLETVQNNQQQLKIWASNCAENFAHQHLLVEAELAYIKGKELEAEKLYQQAIQTARQNDLVQDEGLANELAARFFRQRNFDSIADSFLREARSCFQRWGAAGKVEQLDRQIPRSTQKASLNPAFLAGVQLDAIALVKASQAISDKILLPDLLDTLMRIMLENAGADKGCLILPEGESLSIAVSARVSGGKISVQQQAASLDVSLLPEALINYVEQTRENIILDSSKHQGLFSEDKYFVGAKPLSVLCMPIMRQSNLIGLLYLENSLAQGIFTSDRIKVLELLASQAAISLENATLYLERSRTEQALRTSEEKYRAIFENTGTALIFIEDDTTITICNKAFQQLYGAEKFEIEGRMKWSDFVARPDDLQMMHGYHRTRRTDPATVPQTYEFQMLTKTGEAKDIMVSVTNMPETNQSMASLLDITERKRAEEKIINMTTIIEQTAEGIVLTDKHWVIQYVNPAFAQITGYAQEEIIGQRTTILKSDAHSEDYYKNIRDTMFEGKVWSGRIVNKKKDGTLYEVDATGSPVRDESGKVIHFIGIQRDITNEIKLERQLHQSQKMEAIGTLAGGIAHDFNNILSGILGYSQLLSNKLPTESPLHRYLEQILGASHRATELVKQILTYSRQGEQERKPMELDQIASEVLKLIRASIPASIEIIQEIAITPEEAMVRADETQIHQVLMNLCTNAAHAMRKDGGILTLKLSPLHIDTKATFLHSELPLGPYVKLCVEDTGLGIDPTNLARIFDPYFTTKATGEGTGLGLSVVQGIVENHGGYISVDSKLGEGTCFTLLLPRFNETAQPKKETIKDSPRGSERILFVDDEENLVKLGQELLEDLGYRVTTTTSSLEALETFRSDPKAFDLIVTDGTMPGLSGVDLAKEILQIRPHTPIILCTGFSGDKSLLRAEDSGAREVIMKPYIIEQLASRIRKLIDQAHTETDRI